MKKLSLTLAALLVAGGLVACDKKPEAGKTPGFGKDVPAEAVSPAPAPAPAVTAPAPAPADAASAPEKK